MSDPATGVSRLFFDEEMLALNERIHHLSQRVEEVANRVHSLAGLLEHLPSKVTKLESIGSTIGKFSRAVLGYSGRRLQHEVRGQGRMDRNIV